MCSGAFRKLFVVNFDENSWPVSTRQRDSIGVEALKVVIYGLLTVFSPKALKKGNIQNSIIQGFS